MKKYLFLTGCLLVLAIFVNAQRYAIIDSKYILEKLPEYKESQAKARPVQRPVAAGN